MAWLPARVGSRIELHNNFSGISGVDWMQYVPLGATDGIADVVASLAVGHGKSTGAVRGNLGVESRSYRVRLPYRFKVAGFQNLGSKISEARHVTNSEFGSSDEGRKCKYRVKGSGVHDTNRQVARDRPRAMRRESASAQIEPSPKDPAG